MARFKVYEADYQVWVAKLRASLGENEFDSMWAEGAALSTEDAIAYAQRGRGERKRPHTGWGSLTPAEHEVVRLVCDGLPNKDIAARLFVSPRTVHAHLAHVYTKLGLSSRVRLAQKQPATGLRMVVNRGMHLIEPIRVISASVSAAVLRFAFHLPHRGCTEPARAIPVREAPTDPRRRRATIISPSAQRSGFCVPHASTCRVP